MKNQKGITLIALVITIIVLLILAGVAIAMLSGENGILTKASSSAVETAMSTAKEKVAMEINNAIANQYESTYVNNTPSTAYEKVTAALNAADFKTDVEKDGTVEYSFTAKDETNSVPAYVTVTSKKDSTKIAYGTIDDKGSLSWGTTQPKKAESGS